MRIKKNGKVINLTEADIKKLSKRILREQNETNTTDMDWGDFDDMLIRFHPEIKGMKSGAMSWVFKDGNFSVSRWNQVCRAEPEFCSLFPKGEVLEVLFKTIT